MNRKEFLMMLAAAPLGAKAWEKPFPPYDRNDTWQNDDWQDAYAPKSFIFVKPAVTPIGDGKVAIIWKTRDIATGWAEVSQDGGATWRKVWSGDDGICDTLRTTHVAIVEDYDQTKPLKYRVVSRPIAEYGRFGSVRYSGETIPDSNLQSYFVGRGYNAHAKARAEKYTGEEFAESGEVDAIDPESFEIAMFNDVHHSIPYYPKHLKYMTRKVALSVFAGDICDFARSADDFDKHMMAPMAYIGRHTQSLSCLSRGNHETMGLYAGQVRNHVALQDTGRFYGAFTLGGVRVVILDTGNEVRDKGVDNYYRMLPYLAEETAWLRKEVSSPDWKRAKRRIAFAHIPPIFDNGSYRSAKEPTDGVGGLYQTFVGAGLDLLCAGHTHRSLFRPAGGNQPFAMAVGGGMSDKTIKASDINTLTRVLVEKNQLRVIQTGLDGTTIFDHVI